MESKTSSYYYQHEVRRRNRERILSLLNEGPKRFTDLLNESKLSPKGLTAILKDLENQKKIKRVVHEKKQAYELTKKGIAILTGHYLLRTMIESLEKKGSQYYENYSNVQYSTWFCRLPWGIDDELIIENSIGEKFNPITKDIAAALNEELYKRIKEKIIKKELPIDKNRKGLLLLCFTIDYKDLIDSIEQNSLEYVNKITGHELDILEKLEHGTANKEDVKEIVDMRKKRSKGKSKVEGVRSNN